MTPSSDVMEMLIRLGAAAGGLGGAFLVIGIRRHWGRAIRWGVSLLLVSAVVIGGLHRGWGRMPSASEGLVAALTVLAALALVPRPRVSAELSRSGRPGLRLATGRRARRGEIRRWLRGTSEPGTARLRGVTAYGDSSGLLARSRVRGDLTWPASERAKHILVAGKPGSGKTSQVIAPLIRHDCEQRACSTIVIDTKGDFWRYSELARRTGKTVWLFKPTDLASTLAWNVLRAVETIADAQDLGATVIHATGGISKEEPFWDQSAEGLLTAVIWGLKQRDPDRLSFWHVYGIVQRGAFRVARWLNCLDDTRRLAGDFIGLARGESKNADTILSTLKNRIQIWGDPDVGAATWGNEIDLGRLASEPVYCVIEIPEARMRRLQPLVNIALTEIIRHLLRASEGGKLAIPVSLVIDEFASAVGRLYDIENKLNSVRSRRISIVAALQSLGQLEPLYGPARDAVLGGFGSQIYLADVEQLDAEYAARKSGQQEVVAEGAQATRAPGQFWNTAGSTHAIQTRPVLTTDDIRNDSGLATVFLPRTRVFQCGFTPHFKDNDPDGAAGGGVRLRKSPLPTLDAIADEEAAFRAACPRDLAREWDDYVRGDPGTARHLRDFALDVGWNLVRLMRTWESLRGGKPADAAAIENEMRRHSGF